MAVTKFKTTSSFTNLTKYDSFLAGNAAYSPGAYESIATVNGNGSSGTITFSSIPQTYTSLQIRYIGILSGTASTLRIDWGGSDYQTHKLVGNGTSASAGNSTSASFIESTDLTLGGTSASSVIVGVGIIDIHDYASTTRNKTVRVFGGIDRNGSGVASLVSGFKFGDTNAVTTININTENGNPFTTTTSFALYGIKGA